MPAPAHLVYLLLRDRCRSARKTSSTSSTAIAARASRRLVPTTATHGRARDGVGIGNGGGDGDEQGGAGNEHDPRIRRAHLVFWSNSCMAYSIAQWLLPKEDGSPLSLGM